MPKQARLGEEQPLRFVRIALRIGQKITGFAVFVAASVTPAATQAGLQQEPSSIYSSVRQLRSALDSGAMTAVELWRRYEERIAAFDRGGPQLRSVLALDPSAHQQAALADRLGPAAKRPLSGLPILVKDTIDVRGLPTTGGSVWLKDLVAPQDATVVARLREAGAVILGKTNCDDWFSDTTPGWGWSSLGGQTRNPWHQDYSPGGTSGGSAVAVAAGLAVAALGTDTSGSVLIPASWCGVIGFLPSAGSVSRAGVMPIALSLDRVGILARSVEDAESVFRAIRGWDPADTFTSHVLESPPEPIEKDFRVFRIGVLDDVVAAYSPAAPGVRAFAHALQQLASNGVDVRRGLVGGKNILRLASQNARQIYLAEQLPSLDAYFARQGETAPFANAREMLGKIGAHHFKVRYRDAVDRPPPERDFRSLAVRRNIAEARAVLLRTLEESDLDALALPYSVHGAPRLNASGGSGEVMSLASHSGLPAIVIPIGFTSEGLPLALELIGRPQDDLGLLKVAGVIERHASPRREPLLTPATFTKGSATP